MQKVVYSISKVNRDKKLKGVGYLVEGNLLIPSTSSKGNPYIRVFEDVTKHCHQDVTKKDEYNFYNNFIWNPKKNKCFYAECDCGIQSWYFGQ